MALGPALGKYRQSLHRREHQISIQEHPVLLIVLQDIVDIYTAQRIRLYSGITSRVIVTLPRLREPKEGSVVLLRAQWNYKLFSTRDVNHLSK